MRVLSIILVFAFSLCTTKKNKSDELKTEQVVYAIPDSTEIANYIVEIFNDSTITDKRKAFLDSISLNDWIETYKNQEETSDSTILTQMAFRLEQISEILDSYDSEDTLINKSTTDENETSDEKEFSDMRKQAEIIKGKLDNYNDSIK